MAIHIPWTKHEVALLIDACIRFENTICTRTEIIKELSKKLRELALKNDIKIDDIYRNENGIIKNCYSKYFNIFKFFYCNNSTI